MTTLQRAEAAEHALSQELDRVVVKSVPFPSGERAPRQPVTRAPDGRPPHTPAKDVGQKASETGEAIRDYTVEK